MFTVAERDRVRSWILELAVADPQVVAGAVVGSLANDGGDELSDLDLTFAVAPGVPVDDVLEDWTERILLEFAAERLFDLHTGYAVYRVFLVPGALQVDLSFSPAESFRPRSPQFELLFGTALEPVAPGPFDTAEARGYAIHHLVRARVCIARGRLRQAAYWLAEARHLALAIACSRRGLPTAHGRGFDDLPAAEALDDCCVKTLTADELNRVVAALADALQARKFVS